MIRPLILSLAAATLALTTACQSTEPTAAAEDAMGLTVGDRAPNVTLTAADGRSIRLDDLDKPLVVNFYRGNWCPYCTKALNEWEASADQFRRAGATIIAVSPESLPNITESQDGLSYRVYADPSHQAAMDFGVNFTLDDDTRSKYKNYGIDLGAHNTDGVWDLPVPATYVIDGAGTIQYAYVNPDYTTRATPTEVLQVVRTLN